jgi:hypothetical protein
MEHKPLLCDAGRNVSELQHSQRHATLSAYVMPPASSGFYFCEFTYLSRVSEETYGSQFRRQWLAVLFYVARAALLLEKLSYTHGVYVYWFRYSCITYLTVPLYTQ